MKFLRFAYEIPCCEYKKYYLNTVVYDLPNISTQQVMEYIVNRLAFGSLYCTVYPVKSLPTKSPPTLSTPACSTIKQDTRFKYYLRTAKFRAHVKSCYANIPASFYPIWS